MENPSTFKVHLNYPPNECDCAIVSIDSNGNQGELNQLVLKAYGYQHSDINIKELSRGFYLLQKEKKKPILFIVTVGNNPTAKNLNKNLFDGLKRHIKDLARRSIWVPLMGTGTGGLTLEESYKITLEVIAELSQYANFYISIPDNEEGKEFYRSINPKLNLFEKLDKDSKDIVSIIGNRNFFLAGHLWGNEDQMPRFLEQNIWENGHEFNDTKVVNNAKEGDLIFIKSTYAYGEVSYLRIKAIGVIKENKLDGHNLDVNWYRFNNIDIEHLGKYRRTFQTVSNDDIETILIEVFDAYPNLPNIIKGLAEKRKPEDINEKNEELSRAAERIITIPGLLSDVDSGTDYLDISKDINAFAKVMSAKSFNPPLAIALLGKWGSGKSFFMRKLKERIDKLSSVSTTEQVYCNGIAHVHFNAWSYMDANLWAGMITKIFEGLQEYITNDSKAKGKIDDIAKALNQKLNIAQEEISHLEHRKHSINNKIKVLEGEKTKIEKALKQKINQIKSRSIKTVLKNLDNSFHIKNKIEDALSSNESYIKTEEQLDNIVPKEYWQNPIGLYQRINSKRTFYKMFLKGPRALKNLFWLCIIILIIFLIKIALFFFIPVLGRLDFTFPDKLLYLISIIGAFIYRNYKTVNHLQPLISKFWKIKEDYELKKKEALFKFKQQGKTIEFEIENYKEEIQVINDQINKAKQSKLEIEYKLKHTLTTEALFTFIEKRSSSDDYKKHLGIVSIIRKDFEILSELFSGHQDEINNSGESEEFKKYFSRPLERIILYIDDLDRCSDDRVVQVLEAVNLLMAYPLFIVVVGVDPRWVKNALSKKYELQFGNKNLPDNEAIEPSGYLEKIFQVPFQLKSATDDNVKHMLKNLAESHPQIKSMEEPIEYTDEDEKEINTDNVENDLDIEGGDVDQQLTVEKSIIIKETIEALKFSEKEIVLLQCMSGILGSNPRALKRFVNIYRVIKAHEDFNYTDASEESEVLTVMFLIALPLGCYKKLAKPFEKWLKDEENKFKHLGAFETDSYNELRDDLINTVDQNAPLLLESSIIDFNKHYPFIKRFTFTHI